LEEGRGRTLWAVRGGSTVATQATSPSPVFTHKNRGWGKKKKTEKRGKRETEKQNERGTKKRKKRERTERERAERRELKRENRGEEKKRSRGGRGRRRRSTAALNSLAAPPTTANHRQRHHSR